MVRIVRLNNFFSGFDSLKIHYFFIFISFWWCLQINKGV